MNAPIMNRHDVFVLFDVAMGNPNGDPDAGNMPRIDPATNKGFITDVCLKRKIRNYVEMRKPERQGEEANGYNIFIRNGAVLNNEIAIAEKACGKDPAKTLAWLEREFFDIRTFGAVLGTGKDNILKGLSAGQVQGPVQVTFSLSYHAVTPLEVCITRCAVTREEDKAKERTMGTKHVVPYALYAAKIFISPPLASKTGFNQRDLDLFFEALNQMFTHDHSAARGDMAVRGIYDFEHVGTQGEENEEQNAREARLGCCHAHTLFEGIGVALKPEKTVPESWDDYQVTCKWTPETLPKGVVLHVR